MSIEDAALVAAEFGSNTRAAAAVKVVSNQPEGTAVTKAAVGCGKPEKDVKKRYSSIFR